jgi:hypothetical protein
MTVMHWDWIAAIVVALAIWDGSRTLGRWVGEVLGTWIADRLDAR